MTILETPRLLLRRWRNDDLAPMAAIDADPEVMRWIGSGSVRDRAGTAEAIASWERCWAANGFGLFAVELRRTGELIGFAGLAIPDDLPDIMPAVEIGWRLGRSHWGQGLATEAARAALHFAFTDRGLPRIVGIHQIGNIDSERVMQKLGMSLFCESTEPGDRPVRVYAITQAEYDQSAPRRDVDGDGD